MEPLTILLTAVTIGLALLPKLGPPARSNDLGSNFSPSQRRRPAAKHLKPAL